MALRADLYSAPTAATFEVLEDDLAMVSGSGTVEWSGWTDDTIEIPRDIIVSSGRLVGIYDGPNLIDEFLIESQQKSVSREGKNTWSLSGPQINGLTQKIGIWPQDYPADPSVTRDWIWDGEDVITNGGFEDTSAISEIYELDRDEATGGTFTLTVGGATTPAQVWNVSETVLELAIEALAGSPPVVDVDVDATGDGYNIEFVDPVTLDTNMIYAGSLTGGGGDDELIVIQEGDNTAPPNWTRSQFLDSGSDPRLHGTYASDGFRLTKGTEPVRTGSLALRVNGLTQYAGAQQVINVTPGQTYQGSVWLWSSDTTEVFKLILRDARTHQPLGAQDGGSVPASTWTEFTITDFVVPNDVTQIIFRVASTVDQNPIPWYMDDATFKEGFQPATEGEIIRVLLEAAQARATGDWLDLNFTDPNDTLSVSWGAGIAFRAFPPQSLAHVLEGLHQLGVNWHITRKATPSGALTHDLNAYAKDSAPDKTATVEILSPPQATSVDRLPQATSRIAFGDGGIWDELVDSGAVTSFGRWEGQYDAEHLMSKAAVTDFLTDIQDEEQINRLALQATMYQNAAYVPLVDFRPGDKVEWQIPAIQTTVTRPVKSISWQQAETAVYEITGSKVYDPETGLARAVEFLLDEIKPRAKTSGVGNPTTVASSGPTGAFIHLTRNATQSIASGGELLSWDSLGLQGVGNFVSTVPTTTVTIQQEGYYNVAIQLGWSSFEDGGTITVLRNGLVAWPPDDDPGLWSSTNGQLFEGTAHSIQCVPGDTISVNVNPDDASAQTLVSATLTVYLVDRAANEGLYRELVMSHSPIGYWRLDEASGTNAADETASNDGTYVGTPVYSATGIMQDGSGSTSVEFDGSTEWVTVPQAAVDGLTNLSIEAWIDFDVSARLGIFNVNWSGGNGYNRWGFWVESDRQLIWADGSGGTRWKSSTAMSVDTTYYVVVTRSSGGTLKFYINGVLTATHTSIPVASSSSGDTVQIGMDIDGGSPGDEFDGHMDEVALYDRVLTDTEIAEHYAVGS